MVVFLFFIFLCLIFSAPISASPDIQISDYSSGSEIEWVQLTNNTEDNINIQNWIIRDENDNSNNKNSLTLNGCISGKSFQIFTHNKGWLNNEDDTIYLYNSNLELIDKLIYTTEKNNDTPISTNTCLLPTSTPTPTIVPTSTPTPTTTPTPTNTPTPDPTVTNPTSGIKITEFMPYESTEWIEFNNTNNYPVKLVSWKLEDKDGNTRNVGENGVLSIGANSYTVFGYSAFFDNTNAETVIVRDQNNTSILQTSYAAGLRTLDRSWSLINGNWCQSSITKGYENVTSCYTAATSTPTYSPTPTIDKTKYVADELATASAIIEPTTEPNFLSPTPTSEPTPTSIDGLVLGDSTSLPSSKKNYLPLILIISGGLLLISPVIISKIKFKK